MTFVGTYQYKECQAINSDVSGSFSAVAGGVISYNAGLADTEAHGELSLACIVITCANSGDGARILYANFVDNASWAPGTAGQYPTWIQFIRSSLVSGANITLRFNKSGGGTQDYTITNNYQTEWQQIEQDISALNGINIDSVDILSANGAQTIWISKMWWVNQSRIYNNYTIPAGTNPQYERIICVGAHGYYNNNYDCCLISKTGGGAFVIDAVYNVTGCIIKVGIYPYLTPPVATFTESVNTNPLIGNPNISFMANGRLDSKTGWTLRNIYCYRSDAVLTPAASSNAVVATNVYIYNCPNAIINSNGVLSTLSIFLTTGKVSGSTYYIGYTTDQCIYRLVRVPMSATNPSTRLANNGSISDVLVYSMEDGANSIKNLTPINIYQAYYCIKAYTSINFLTNPVTAGLVVSAQPTITDTLVEQETCITTTDGSGKTSNWALTGVYGGQKTKAWSAADPNGWVFWFMNTGTMQVLARYPSVNTFDITNGVGTPASPVTINLTDSAPVVFSVSISPAVGATNKDALTLTAVITGTPVPDRVYAVLTDGTYYKVKVMALVSGNTYQCVYPPSWAWVKTYTTAQLYVDATNSYGRGTGNLGASYTVAEGDGTNAADIMYDGQQVRKQVQSQIVTVQN